jgi:hypothetical protein
VVVVKLVEVVSTRSCIVVSSSSSCITSMRILRRVVIKYSSSINKIIVSSSINIYTRTSISHIFIYRSSLGLIIKHNPKKKGYHAVSEEELGR